MKVKALILPVLSLAVLLSMQSCKEKYITYEGQEYIMFADTAKTYAVREDILSFEIPVVSTVKCGYDRTFAVEIIDSESSAVEGRDFSLGSNTITIPSGSNKTSVKVRGKYDNLVSRKDLSFTLKLIAPDALIMPQYGDKTKVTLKKTSKFKRENFTGWAVVTSVFLYQYSISGTYQRLIKTSPDPENPNGVILHNFLFDGYDVSIWFDDETDPVNPTLGMKPGQVVSDEGSVFGMVHGDNHILVDLSVLGQSYFLGQEKIAVIINRFYVENIGDAVGTVGDFMSEIDWVSDEEAERLRLEDGM